MPYHIDKMPGGKAYVMAEDGKRLSLKPLPLMMAKKQLIAVNIAHAVRSGQLKKMGKK
jgi:hypothetical protein